MVIETMQEEELGYRETAQRFENRSDRQVRNWERIYLTEGPEVFAVERRGAGVDRLFGLLQQPQNQGKAKRLAACNTQTASSLGCLIDFCLQILSNFLGSIHVGAAFYISNYQIDSL